ncbi:MAG: tRNA 2-thiouridine(34) synthase MnmA [Planctomycetota bacterium]|nr:tRNA 2-thiouridine(34) synthase MnmA [Planctomycetota bacterium]
MTVAIALSGGVDSSVALLYLLNFGVDLKAFTLLLGTGAGDEKDAEDAAKVCKQLGVEHNVVDASEEFEELVVDDFVREYRMGRTPNPCVRCNERIKFGLLRHYAEQAGCDDLATGHYARIIKDDGFGLYRASDHSKDQSYALYRLNREQLSHTLFPLGDVSKDQVRRSAERAGLVTSRRSESQDICFVDEDYTEFLAEYGLKLEPGEMVNVRGEVIGEHRGIHCYTIGQRRNLGLPGGTEPLYVIGIDVSANRVLVGPKSLLLCRAFDVGQLNWLVEPPRHGSLDCLVKVRYRSPMLECRVFTEGNVAQVRMHEPHEAVTPGQSAVFYSGDRVLGGGIISTVMTGGTE